MFRPLERLLGNKPFRLDVTNIPGMDDLHQPQDIIKAAQQLAAKTFGAERTYFLVNGSSCGLQALVLAVCNPGDRIILPRNIHRSILSGVILSGATPLFYLPEYDEKFSIPLGTLPETINTMLNRHPDAKAVLVINPTYHGVTSDIKMIADIAHHAGVPLLVDEAHGPHLCFHPKLPGSSLSQGADAVVHGTHKLLSALTQASMLHLQGTRVEARRVESALRLLQSTSTSYLLLASLDAARAQMDIHGHQLLEISQNHADYLRENIKLIKGLEVYSHEEPVPPLRFGLDPCKVTISFRNWPFTGLEIERLLRQKYNIQVEMADVFNILLLISHATTRRECNLLLAALRSLGETLPEIRTQSPTNILNARPPSLELKTTPRSAFFAPAETVALEEAAGRICAETIACYPPGIPVACPGEQITPEIVEYLSTLRSLNVRFQGCQDCTLKTVCVTA